MGVAAFELGIGLADLGQWVDVRDRDLEVSCGDQSGQFGECFGARPGIGSGFGFDAVLGGCGEIGDGVDPFGRDAEGEGQFDISAAVGVDEGVDPSRCGGFDSVDDAVEPG